MTDVFKGKNTTNKSQLRGENEASKIQLTYLKSLIQQEMHVLCV